jgi:hypothetical protein
MRRTIVTKSIGHWHDVKEMVQQGTTTLTRSTLTKHLAAGHHQKSSEPEGSRVHGSVLGLFPLWTNGPYCEQILQWESRILQPYLGCIEKCLLVPRSKQTTNEGNYGVEREFLGSKSSDE